MVTTLTLNDTATALSSKHQRASSGSTTKNKADAKNINVINANADERKTIHPSRIDHVNHDIVPRMSKPYDMTFSVDFAKHTHDTVVDYEGSDLWAMMQGQIQ